MRRFLPSTLFWQLVLGTLLAQALFLIVFISYTVVSQIHSAEQRSQKRAVLQLDRLAAACAKPLAAGDMASVRAVLELSRIAPSIEIARLTDLTGRTLAVTENGRTRGLDVRELQMLQHPAQRSSVFEVGDSEIEAVTPVRLDGRPVALLWLEPNHAITLNTPRVVTRVALDYGLLALLTNILPIFLIARTMTRPVRHLRAATQRVIRHPDLTTGFPLPVRSANEAGELTASFNKMVQELQEQRSGLLETLALLDSMLAYAPIGFAFVDRDLRFVRLNHAFADMCETTEEQRGRLVREACSAPVMQRMQPSLLQVFDTGEALRNVEVSSGGRSVSSSQRTWLMHCYPVRTQQTEVRWVGVVVVEITDRLRSDETLRKSEKLAAAGRLAASIAHEINNPLEAVTNLLYLLAHYEPLDTTARHYVLSAQAELERVSEITQQTLRFYRQSTRPALTNVADIIDSVLTLYHSRIVSAQVTVSKRIRGEAVVFAFGGELRQLFANLIGNALDAMPQGGRLLLSVHSGTSHAPEGIPSPGIRASVCDTGMGMSPETLHRIFEAFFTTKEITGTGLGLWVSEEIIRKHNGSVRVRSRQGSRSGTCFTVFLPSTGVGAEGRKAPLTSTPQ